MQSSFDQDKVMYHHRPPSQNTFPIICEASLVSFREVCHMLPTSACGEGGEAAANSIASTPR